jgi:ABC-type transporter Mla maintaining outer membrane lipid asymmetry ATPase subunit MlaF
MGRNWQQRAGLARALALKPEVLLLDNALTGLDPRDAFWWLQFLDRLSRGEALPDQKPMTLVATADDLRPWRDRARQFALLKDRRLVVLGDQKRLAEHPEPLLRDLLPGFVR